MKFLLLSIFTIFHFLISESHAHAAGEFRTEFHSEYRILDETQTQVSHKIFVTNNLAHIYTTNYRISLGSTSVDNLQVLTSGVTAKHKRTISELDTALDIEITDPVIGKDQTLEIDIAYTTSDIVVKTGRVWEINIPRATKANEAEKYTRRIIVPQTLGEPRVTTPQPTSRAQDENGNSILEYVGYPSNTLTLLFGEAETYEVNLTYDLENPTITDADTELALPPDTEYQRVLVASIEPEPVKVYLDQDSNWLAIYRLKAREKIVVKATLYITVRPVPEYLSLESNTAKLTSNKPYWDTKSGVVRDLAQTLKTPENIYNYLRDKFEYNYGRREIGSDRKGAAIALSSQDQLALCTEYTDSFVAISRAAGIPAREINGYAYSHNQEVRPSTLGDILHSWPEYYDRESGTWRQVDPTWGDTTGGVDYFHKLDYGHIAFVRHGAESTYPYPAGAYKNDSNKETVSVKIADSVPSVVEDYAEFRENGKTYIKNTGNVALSNYKLNLDNGSQVVIDYLPPFGQHLVDNSILGTSSVMSVGEKIKKFFRNLYCILRTCEV